MWIHRPIMQWSKTHLPHPVSTYHLGTNVITPKTRGWFLSLAKHKSPISQPLFKSTNSLLLKLFLYVLLALNQEWRTVSLCCRCYYCVSPLPILPSPSEMVTSLAWAFSFWFNTLLLHLHFGSIFLFSFQNVLRIASL